MRARFKDDPSLTSSQLQHYWIERAQYWMSIETGGRGRVDKNGSINPLNPVIPRAYDPCF